MLLVTALALMLTIDRTLNAIWRVRKPRPIAQRVLVYWAALTLGPLLLGVSLTLTSYAISASRGLVARCRAACASLLGTMRVRAAGRRHGGAVPLRAQHPRALAPRAGPAACSSPSAFEVAKRCSAWYLGLVPSYSVVYGAFATLPILLLWIYLCWVIVLLGAVIAAYAPSLPMRVVRVPDTPGYRFALAVALLRELARARGADKRGLTLTQLAGAAAHRSAAGRAGAGAADGDRLGGAARRRRRASATCCWPTRQRTLAAPLIDGLLLGDDRAASAFRRAPGWTR